MFYIEERK